MYFIHDINQNKVVSRSPFWGIPERVIDINDRFISVMNDKDGDIFCVFTCALPANRAWTAPNSPAVLNSAGAPLSTAHCCYNIKR